MVLIVYMFWIQKKLHRFRKQNITALNASCYDIEAAVMAVMGPWSS
jgi:hypothetical protein